MVTVFCEVQNRKERSNFPDFFSRYTANDKSTQAGHSDLFFGRCHPMPSQLLVGPVADPCLLPHGLSTNTVLAGFTDSSLRKHDRFATDHAFLFDLSHNFSIVRKKKLIVKPPKGRGLLLDSEGCPFATDHCSRIIRTAEKSQRFSSQL